MYILIVIGAVVVGVITSIFGYGWFENGAFNKTGCFLNLFLVTAWNFIVYIMFNE